MNNSQRIARWIVALVVVAIGGALLGWYFYLRTSAAQDAATVAERGLNTAAPSFNGTTGSTNENIALATQSSGTGTASSTFSSPRYWQVSNLPVAGADFMGSTTLTYVARSTGYLFTADPRKHAVARLTNTLRPQVYEAYLAPGGYTLERTIGQDGSVTTFLGTLASSTATSTDRALVGIDLSGEIDAVAVNQTTHAVLYLAHQSDGSTLGMTSDWTGTKQKRLFASPLSQWLLWYLPDGRVIIAQKPADGVEGYAYEVGKTGALSELAHGQGLTVLPRSGSTALLIGASAGDGSLSLYALPTSKSKLEDLGVATVADKCVWASGTSLVAYCAVPSSIPSNTFLDDWYRGAVHTTDTWLRIDVLSGSTTPLFDSTSGDPQLDVRDPTIDSSGSYIAFENASDNSLWVLTLPQ